MIKQLIQKLFATALAFLVLVSTMSFTVEKHFCGGELVGVSVFTDDFDCMPVGCEAVNEVAESHCCKGVVDVINGVDSIRSKVTVNSFVQQLVFLKPKSDSFLSFYSSFKRSILEAESYTPPDRVDDIIILDQVFII